VKMRCLKRSSASRLRSFCDHWHAYVGAINGLFSLRTSKESDRIMIRFLYWLSGRLRCRIIADKDGTPYLERYYVGTVFGVRFLLHRFVASDPLRGFHDHPWPWAGAVVLSGFYYEQTRSGVRAVRHINGLVGDSFHRVILPAQSGEPFDLDAAAQGQPRSCWTLFFHRAKYTKPWGFLRGSPPTAEHLTEHVGHGSTTRIWIPHNYPLDGAGTDNAWWNTAPYGRDEPRRFTMDGTVAHE
jgi:hypothetical protein